MSREQQGVAIFLSLALGLFFFLTGPTPRWKEVSRIPSEEGKSNPRPEEGQVMVEVDGSVNQKGMVQVESGSSLASVLEKAGGIKGEISLPPEALATKVEKSLRLRAVVMVLAGEAVMIGIVALALHRARLL